MTLLALVFGAVLAVLCVIYVARPFLREPDPLDDRLDTLGELERRRLALEEERDRALAALKELEFDHRTGAISDEDYRALVGPLRRQAADALRALDRRPKQPGPGVDGSMRAGLGGVVYSGNGPATESVRGELDRLDRATSAKEAEMTVLTERVNERVARGRVAAHPTEVVEPPVGPATPQPPTIPEPTPVPHDPPEPPTIPEPTPVPHEPPQQPDIPEPYPEPAPEPPPGGSTQKN
jgi:hypothetical protein